MPFQQTCSPACYWGGLCNANRCVKQRNSCLVFCPDGFSCSYGYCVAKELVPLFLQELTPYLYTVNARVQPNDPNTPLYIGDGTSDAPPASNNGLTGAATHQTAPSVVATLGLATFAAVAGLLRA
jgi:hypothetical protein